MPALRAGLGSGCKVQQRFVFQREKASKHPLGVAGRPTGAGSWHSIPAPEGLEQLGGATTRGCHQVGTQSFGGAPGQGWKIPGIPQGDGIRHLGMAGFQSSPGERNDHGLRDGAIDFILSLISISPCPGMFSAEVLFKTALIHFPLAAAVLLIGNWDYLTGFTWILKWERKNFQKYLSF